MRRIILFTILLSAFTLQAQEQFEWVKTYGGNGDDEGYKCAVDPSGDIVFTGVFSDTMTLGDEVLYSKGSKDMYLIKSDIEGNIIWSVRAGGNSGYSTIGRAVDTDADGNIFVGGVFRDSIKVGTQVYYGEDVEYYDNFLIKYNETGEPLWVKVWDGPGGDCIEDLMVYENQVVIAGSYKSTIDIEGTVVESEDPDVANNYNPFVTAFDLDGNMLWLDKIDCRSGTCRSIDIDTEGLVNLIIEVKGNPVLHKIGTDYQSILKQTSSGSVDNYIIQLNGSNGELNWSNRMGSDGFEMGYAIVTDQHNNVYSGGLYQNEITMESQDGNFQKFTSNGSFDYFISKYDQNGNLLWGDAQGGSSIEGVLDLAVTRKGNLYAAAYYLDPETQIEDTSFSCSDGNEALLVKYDSDGNYLSAQTSGTTGNSGYVYALDVTEKDSLLILGHYQGEGTFFNGDTYPNANTEKNIWLSLMKDVLEETETPEDTVTGITQIHLEGVKIYPNPATDYIIIEKPESVNDIKVKIYNTSGLLQKSCDHVQGRVNLGDLETGIYLVAIITDQGLTTRKISVTK